VEKIELIFNTYYNELIDYEHWDHIHIERYNLVALALVHIKNNDLKLVLELFKYFNSESNFHVNDDYQKILYSIALFHYQHQLFGKGKETSKVKREYLKLVQKTGFTFFTESFLVNYFN
jgi:phosphomevalonate kinase